MTRKLENIGNRLIGMFVPRISAGACGSSYCGWWADCYQCSHHSCAAACRVGCGCTKVICGGICS